MNIVIVIVAIVVAWRVSSWMCGWAGSVVSRVVIGSLVMVSMARLFRRPSSTVILIRVGVSFYRRVVVRWSGTLGCREWMAMHMVSSDILVTRVLPRVLLTQRMMSSGPSSFYYRVVFMVHGLLGRRRVVTWGRVNVSSLMLVRVGRCTVMTD